MKRALLVNLGSPEMDRLAAELATRGALLGLVRRYVNKGRWWERSLAALPLLGQVYAATLGRRLPPAGLDGGSVIEAGVLADFAFAFSSRVRRVLPRLAGALGKRLLVQTERAVSQGGCRHVARAEVVVANYHVALPVLRAARAAGRRTILNYPIAHHRWQYRFYAEQAARQPEFAAALPQFGSIDAHAATLDQEIELADMVLVGSAFVRDTFVSEGIDAAKIRVIPYGADAARFQPAAERRGSSVPFRIVFVGQIGERKGISYLLKAYEQFRKPDTELHLVGDFVAGSEVYRPYRELFTHTPNVPQVQLPALLQAADVFVLPTLVEGMPMVVLEAMACGIPVIVTPNGPGEVVRDGLDGYVIPVCDAAALVDRLERLYADPALRRELGRNARMQALQWPWARFASAAADLVLASAGSTT